MNLKNKKIAFGLTSPFYALKATLIEIKKIVSEGGEVFPIISKDQFINNIMFEQFYTYTKKIEEITNKKIIDTVEETENIKTDIMVIAPCSRK